METYKVVSTSNRSAEITPVILDENLAFRRVLYATINNQKIEEGETLSAKIVCQRKNKDDVWEDIPATSLASLKAGDMSQFTFKSEQLKRFYDVISELYAVSAEGIPSNNSSYAVTKINPEHINQQERIRVIEQLILSEQGDEFWRELAAAAPELATRLAYSQIQFQRNIALQKFSENLKNELPEQFWQDFFNDNQWIFGYGLKYCFLNQITDQPHYGNVDVFGLGNQKGDFLLQTEADARFTVLVEIKKPDTRIFTYKQDGEVKKYRNGACLLSGELIGAVSQVQANCLTWQRTSKDSRNKKLVDANIYTVQPKGILVIGNTIELGTDEDKISTFETYRRNLQNPEIITFDELFERARFIVENKANKRIENIMDDHDIPF